MEQSEPNDPNPPIPGPTGDRALADAEEMFRRGKALFDEGQYEEALMTFARAAKLNPRNAEALVYRGVIYTRQNRLHWAMAEFEKALELDPASAWAHDWYGATLAQAKIFDQAIEHLTEAIRLKPQSASIHLNRGVAFHNQAVYDAAMSDYNEAIRLDANCDRAYSFRGRLYVQLKRYEEAIADLSRALQRNPTDPELLFNRGIAFHCDQDYVAAVDDYTTAIELDPQDARALVNRSVAWVALDDPIQGLADLNQAIRIDPSNARAFKLRGRIHHRDEWDAEAALADFAEAIRLDPTIPDTFRLRGELYSDLERFDDAIADLSQAIRLASNDASALRSRAICWQHLDEFDKADSDFTKALELQAQEDAMFGSRNLIQPLLKAHFELDNLESLTITERRFPTRVRADLQRALNRLFERLKLHHFCGVQTQYTHEELNFTRLLMRVQNDPPISAPPQFEEIDIGEVEPVRCVKSGLWLFEDDGQRLAILWEPVPPHRFGAGARFQVAAKNSESGIEAVKRFFKQIEDAVREASSYRGKILSLESDEDYSGSSMGIKVHKLHRVERDQVILPRETLDLLDRNIIQFAQQRKRLAQFGMSTKKGLLFYGPPGTGKTHTIHYLAATLPGTTTLLISAEQVGLLGEYMTLARLLQPSLVVLEDADLIARERTTMNSVCEEVLLNKLLNEMDGLKETADVMFVLTTNRPEALEAALASRPGRIDQAIEFPYPDAEGREKLVRLYSRGAPVSDEVVRETVAKTGNVSAAFIKELMRRATQFQLERESTDGISVNDVNDALDELLFKGGSLNRKLLGGKVGESIPDSD